METLTSAKNPALKEIRKAIARGGLTERGLCVAEGFHLLEEALRGGLRIEAVFVTEDAQAAVTRLIGPKRITLVSEPLFRTIASTETSQGVLALVRPPAWKLAQLFGPRPLIVALDGIQDPGNAGAIIRASEAFGASGVMLLKGSVDPYNPKALRASAGSTFRVPLIAALEATAFVEAARDLNVYALLPGGDQFIHAADLTAGCALVIGAEGRGVSAQLREASRGLRIETHGVESLNAAMAAGIALYEAHKQRTR
jgi:TrmH family RNA methyltransferase